MSDYSNSSWESEESSSSEEESESDASWETEEEEEGWKVDAGGDGTQRSETTFEKCLLRLLNFTKTVLEIIGSLNKLTVFISLSLTEKFKDHFRLRFVLRSVVVILRWDNSLFLIPVFALCCCCLPVILLFCM